MCKGTFIFREITKPIARTKTIFKILDSFAYHIGVPMELNKSNHNKTPHVDQCINANIGGDESPYCQ